MADIHIVVRFGNANAVAKELEALATQVAGKADANHTHDKIAGVYGGIDVSGREVVIENQTVSIKSTVIQLLGRIDNEKTTLGIDGGIITTDNVTIKDGGLDVVGDVNITGGKVYVDGEELGADKTLRIASIDTDLDETKTSGVYAVEVSSLGSVSLRTSYVLVVSTRGAGVNAAVYQRLIDGTSIMRSRQFLSRTGVWSQWMETDLQPADIEAISLTDIEALE